MRPLEGRVAIVTGASRGIGAAIVARLSADGATVIGASRSGTLAGPGEPRALDVAAASAVDALVDETVALHGGLDILVNNAGVQLVKTVADTTDAEFDDVMNVNVRGVFNCCRAAIPAMRGRGGVIVNIGSTAAEHADHGMAVYLSLIHI